VKYSRKVTSKSRVDDPYYPFSSPRFNHFTSTPHNSTPCNPARVAIHSSARVAIHSFHLADASPTTSSALDCSYNLRKRIDLPCLDLTYLDCSNFASSLFSHKNETWESRSKQTNKQTNKLNLSEINNVVVQELRPVPRGRPCSLSSGCRRDGLHDGLHHGQPVPQPL